MVLEPTSNINAHLHNFYLIGEACDGLDSLNPWAQGHDPGSGKNKMCVLIFLIAIFLLSLLKK